ncbi:MAG: arginine--tRNA ligase [Gammaproteobacteria bacterium]|nr:arginine--tRNA ligase [Gammaproteobacteria bacterium]
MKHKIEDLIRQAIHILVENDTLDASMAPDIQVTRTKDASHGDFASNIALTLAKAAGRPPRDLAQAICDALPDDAELDKTEIAGPGFINFFVSADISQNVIKMILAQGEDFGRSSIGAGKKIQLEFVSANPTGPLHVGHGRGAAYGASVASLMRAAGFDVDCEYYVNDAGRQMNILAVSIWIRYLQEHDIDIPFPSNGYKSDAYIFDIARKLKQDHDGAFVFKTEEVMHDIHPDEPAEDGDKELHIDGLIERAQNLLGEAAYLIIFNAGLDSILADIRDDLEDFGVHYENWYSEKSLGQRDLINTAVEQLQAAGHIYEHKGALWFKSTDFGDEKDRVVIRDNGQATYFASDIAYHMDKFQRGYERVINIWGADHHGYVPRVKAAIRALGEDENKLDILLVQFAILYRGGERVQMSTRSGSFVTLRELREEVGNDAARFFYVMRKCEQHMDFDLDLAKSQSNDNPVYYIQYAHARVCSVLNQLKEKNLQHDIEKGNSHLAQLTESHETELITKLATYPDVLEKAAINAEPHSLVHYLRELANLFHTYYNAHQFIVEDDAIRDARLNLIRATRQVIHNGLSLLGVSSPESM